MDVYGEYGGFSNYATYRIFIDCTAKEEDYRRWNERAKAARYGGGVMHDDDDAAATLAREIREYTLGCRPYIKPGVYSDILREALTEDVDYKSIARALLD